MSTKIIQLQAYADDGEMGLTKGEIYYPVTGADAVKGLPQMINSQVAGLSVATNSANGLMSMTDKQKLDSISVEPISGLRFKSPNGSIFMLQVTDDGQTSWVKE